MDILIYILIGVLSRILPHPANFTAVGGLAVFGGSRLNPVKALLMTFVTMGISDLIIGFHSAMWATYLGMMAAVLAGKYIASSGKITDTVKAAVLSSIVFYLLTNFAVWWGWQTMYPKNIYGLVECYIAALPFLRNSLLGDVFYAGAFQAVYSTVLSHKITPKSLGVFQK